MENILTEEKFKIDARSFIDLHRAELIELSLKIHANPEIGFKEEKASTWLTTYLEKSAFRIKRGLADLPTAFEATYGKGYPVIALLAEYDALPDVGHACGHNIIAVSSVGAAIASKTAIDNYGGTVMVIGTPAEELFGGKVLMLNKGVFEGIDAAMIVHPGVRNIVVIEALACINHRILW
jgi:amidohydrolase